MRTFQLGLILVLMSSFSIGNAFAWGRFPGGEHPDYGGQWAHRNPVVVHNTYVRGGGAGCVGCGVGIAAVAGLVGGVILGAAIAGNQPSAPPPQTVVVQQAPPPMGPPPGPPPGVEVATLPGGCNIQNINGVQLYQCGPTWYQPFFGGNGVYYSVVPPPS